MMSKSDQGQQTILVVDDEKNYRFVLARLFESVGHRVLLADGPETAMSLLQREKVSLILSDVRMSGMDGLSFCERVQREIGRIPCIVFTAEASKMTRDTLARAGVRCCLDKPFDNRVVLNMVANIMLSRSGERDVVAPVIKSNLNRHKILTTD